jgi:ATP-dependent helicase/nuclease subunit B
MTTFLEEVASKIHTKTGGSIGELVVIVPSRQIGRKLQNALSTLQSSSVWSPSIYTLSDFIELHSGLKVSPRIHLLPLLYTAYQKTGFRPQTFDDFVALGETLMSDFDDVLLSMANEKLLFDDLRNIKDIEDWSFQLGELTESQDRFLHLWKCMGETFDAFLNLQRSQSIYSYSLLLREFISTDNLASLKGEYVFIAGNTLHKAEKELLSQLGASVNLSIYCDHDEYYMEARSHEAGNFLKKILHGLDVEQTDTHSWKNSSKTIYIRSSQTLVGCCMKSSSLLSTATENTGFIVAHKDMMLPVIEHLPADLVQNINIAGGYPLQITPVFRLLQSILDIHANAEQRKENVARWYYKDLLHLVRNGSIDGNDVTGIEKYLIDRHLVYLDKSDVSELQTHFPRFGVISPFFTEEIHSGKKMIELLYQLLRNLEETTSDSMSKNLLVEAFVVMEKCEDFLSRYDFASTIHSLNFIWKRFVQEHSLPFIPSTKNKIEILLLKDSLFADFDRLVVVGANEGELPHTPHTHSLIPRDVRRVFGVPVPEDEEERQAYLFYRLLQRPSEVHLFYSSLPKSFGNSEKSRYITQLTFESPENIEIVYDAFKSEIHTVSKSFTQDENSRERIKDRIKQGLSASAIATYYNCPLDYFYKYVLGLGEAPIMEESIHASTFGTIAHAVLESFYRPHIGSFPVEKDYDSFLANLEAIVREKFNEHYSIKQSHSGKNFISIHVLTETLSRFLKSEKNELSTYKDRTIYAIEHQVKVPITVDVLGESIEIHLKGTIDRIDRTEDGFEIIDFKTGKVNESDLDVKSVGAAFAPKKGKMIQVILYLYMAHKELKVDPKLIRACLISLQKFKQGRVFGFIGDNSFLDQKDLAELETTLGILINDLLDIRDFEHRSSNTFCEYCN